MEIFGVYFKINTTDKVLIGEVFTDGKVILEVEYQVYLYDFTGKLINMFKPDVYEMFNPFIYKNYIIYNDYFGSNMSPFVQFMDFNGNKLFKLEYGYECGWMVPNTKMDKYGNIISYLCGILNIWVN